MNIIPAQAGAAFRNGDERQALTLLRRGRDQQLPDSLAWAQLERLVGLVLIHILREVEGTFALERADRIVELHTAIPWTLEDLETAGLESPQ